MIKVIVGMLNRRPGDIVDVNDVDFDTFRSWASNEDKNSGSIICRIMTEEEYNIYEKSKEITENEGVGKGVDESDSEDANESETEEVEEDEVLAAIPVTRKYTKRKGK